MRFYKATATIRLAAGVVLALTAEQAQPRQHLLTIAEDGTITTREPVEFKAGEIVGFEQEPRGLLSKLEALEFDDDGDGEMFGDGHHAGGEGDITETAEGASGGDDIKQLDAASDAGGGTDIIETVGADLSAQAGTEDKAESESADATACTDGLAPVQGVVYANLDDQATVKSSKKSAK